jgi:hypothetical protein
MSLDLALSENPTSRDCQNENAAANAWESGVNTHDPVNTGKWSNSSSMTEIELAQRLANVERLRLPSMFVLARSVLIVDSNSVQAVTTDQWRGETTGQSCGYF